MSSLSRKDLPQLSVTSSNIEDIMSRAYDSFEIQLSCLQLLYSKPGTVSKRAAWSVFSWSHRLLSQRENISKNRLFKFAASFEEAVMCLHLIQNIYFPLCDRWWLEKGSKAEAVTAPHPGASGPEHHLQPSHGGYRLSHGKVRFCLVPFLPVVVFFVFL